MSDAGKVTRPRAASTAVPPKVKEKELSVGTATRRSGKQALKGIGSETGKPLKLREMTSEDVLKEKEIKGLGVVRGFNALIEKSGLGEGLAIFAVSKSEEAANKVMRDLKEVVALLKKEKINVKADEWMQLLNEFLEREGIDPKLQLRAMQVFANEGVVNADSQEYKALKNKVLVESFKELFSEMSKPIGLPEGRTGEELFGMLEESRVSKTAEFNKFFESNKEYLRNNPEAGKNIFIQIKKESEGTHWEAASIAKRALVENGLWDKHSSVIQEMERKLDELLTTKPEAGTEAKVISDVFTAAAIMPEKYEEAPKALLDGLLGKIADFLMLKGYELIHSITFIDSHKLTAIEYLLQRPDVSEPEKLKAYIQSLEDISLTYYFTGGQKNWMMDAEQGNRTIELLMKEEVFSKLPADAQGLAISILGRLAPRTTFSQSVASWISDKMENKALSGETQPAAVRQLAMLVDEKETRNKMVNMILDQMKDAHYDSLKEDLLTLNSLVVGDLVDEEIGNMIANAILDLKDDPRLKVAPELQAPLYTNMVFDPRVIVAFNVLYNLENKNLVDKPTQNKIAEWFLTMMDSIPSMDDTKDVNMLWKMEEWLEGRKKNHLIRDRNENLNIILKALANLEINEETGKKLAGSILTRLDDMELKSDNLDLALKTLDGLVAKEVVDKVMANRMTTAIFKILEDEKQRDYSERRKIPTLALVESLANLFTNNLVDKEDRKAMVEQLKTSFGGTFFIFEGQKQDIDNIFQDKLE